MRKQTQLFFRRIKALFILTLLWMYPINLFTFQPKNEAPFIYYYTPVNKAFIIERADGKDSRILTNFVIPASCHEADDCSVDGPGWSPSGQWFAWTIKNDLYRPPIDAHAMVINRDGTKKIDILEGKGSVQNLHWSTTEDLLLFERHVPDVNQTLEYYVWNAQEQKTTLSLVISNKFSQVDWTPSGKYVAIYTATESKDGSKMQVLSSTGQSILERSIAPISDKNNFPICTPQWSISNRVIYIGPDFKLQVEDLASGSSVKLDFSSKFIIKADWSPNSKYVLLYTGDKCEDASADATSQLWLLSLPDRAIQEISQTAHLGFANKPTDPYHSTLWSPEGDKAAFVEGSDDSHLPANRLNFITPSPKNILELLVSDTSLYYRSEFASWLDKDRFVYFVPLQSGKSSIYEYDVVSKKTRTLVKDVSMTSNFSISQNTEFIAFGNSECQGACVFNIRLGNKYNVKTQYQTSNEHFSAEDFAWHFTQNWLFLAGNRVGDGYWLNVSTADGTILRNLGGGYPIIPSSFGWLPW